MKIFNIKFIFVILFLSLFISVFAQDDFSRRYKGIRIPLGKTFTIDLDSNPSTEFSWQLVDISNKKILEIVKKEYVSAGSLTVGAAQTEQWSFKTINTGKTVLTFEYRRPWEDNEQAQKIETYTIICLR